MSEVIMINNSRDWSQWFLIHCITEAQKDGIIDKIPLREGGGLEVTLIINGVEVPVLATLQHLEKFHDKFIKEKAQEVIGEIAGEVQEIISAAQKDMVKKLSESGFLKEE